MNIRYFIAFFILNLQLCLMNLPLKAQLPDMTWVKQLPVIELTYDIASFETESFSPASLTYYEADTTRQYACTIRHRGGSSVVFDKPSYSIKFLDEAGASLDVSFLDMRSDNYWILDAAAGDQSKIRNRASMDLWLDFSHKPYHQAQEPKAINGTRGHFVELYANGSYAGLYCLSERIDRKQLKLKKFKSDIETGESYYRGLLYKAVYSIGTRTPFFMYNSEKPSSDRLAEWDGMKNEYPDVLDGEPWSWEPLLLSIRRIAYKSSQFPTYAKSFFDLPVFIDYVLFVDLMCGLDNVGKNYYCWYYDYSSGDTRLGYTPWDMDATWGRDWAGEKMSADRPLTNRTNLHTRLAESYPGYADTLAMRYAELRFTHWAEDSVCSYFDRYFDLFDQTGAMTREVQRWKDSNCRVNTVASEKEYLHEWIHDRLAYMDGEYNFDPEAIQVPKTDTDEHSEDACDLFGRPVTNNYYGLIIKSGKKIIIR